MVGLVASRLSLGLCDLDLSRDRKAALALIRKMGHYASGDVLEELCDPDLLSVNFGVQLTHVLAIVLDNDDDDDGHMTALLVIGDVMAKCQETFLDHFARFGVFQMVHSLAGPPPQDEMSMRDDDQKVRFSMRDDDQKVLFSMRDDDYKVLWSMRCD